MAHSRLAYCKNGDVAAELAALGDAPTYVPGGPSHYIGTFLRWTGEHPIMLLSFNQRRRVHRTARAHATTLPRGPLKNPILTPLSKVRIFMTTLARLLAFRPSWVLCAASGPALWACYTAARLLGIPFVHTRHDRFGGGADTWARRLETRCNGWVIRRAAAVICHGPFLREQLRRIGVPANRLLEFNLSYRYLVDAQAPPPRAPTNVPPTVLYVGRMQRNKGIFDLLQAMQPAFENVPELRLVYAGDGPDLARLQAAVDDSPWAARVQVLGHVPHQRIPQLVREARVVATPTRAELPESRCKAAIEALVLGRPVIAPDAGPFPYVIEHRANGLLYREHDVEDLGRQIALVLNDDALYQQLLQGARTRGAQLLDSAFNFEDALEAAYALTAPGLPAAHSAKRG